MAVESVVEDFDPVEEPLTQKNQPPRPKTTNAQ